jgi:hypothetical protein
VTKAFHVAISRVFAHCQLTLFLYLQGASGRVVLELDVLSLCVFQTSSSTNTQLWWDYTAAFGVWCFPNNFSSTCASDTILTIEGLPLAEITACVLNADSVLDASLEKMAEFGIVSDQAVVNGVVLDVSSSAQDITTAICQDMQTPLPEVCV